MFSLPFMFFCMFFVLLTGGPKKKTKQIKHPRSLLITRVSTAEQKKGKSLETQEVWGRSESRLRKIPLIGLIKDDMSGEIFIEKYYAEIMEKIEKQHVTHVFVYSYDRLTRSFPHGVWLVYNLWKKGVIIVTKSFTADPSKHTHRIRVWLSIFFAEMEHGGISERTRRGTIHKLKTGEYSREKPPFGYDKIDLKLHLKKEYKPVIEDIFDFFISLKSYAEVRRRINIKYEKTLDKPLPKGKVHQIINNWIYAGYYSYDGMLFGEEDKDDSPRPELQAVSKEIFLKANKIAEEIWRKNSHGNNDLPSCITKGIEEYGLGPVVDRHEALTFKCPLCESTEHLTYNGYSNRNNTAMRNLICKNPTHGNGYAFRVPNGVEIKQSKNLNPRRCMDCGSVDDFTISESQLKDYNTVKCNVCGFELLVKKKDIFIRDQEDDT